MKIGDQNFPNLRRKASGFYWEPPNPARAAGFGGVPLGKELDDGALERYVRAQAALERHRRQKSAQAPRRGTVDWLLGDYFQHRFFTRLPEKTSRDYRNKLIALANFRLLDGSRFGSLNWLEIEAQHTDKFYEMFCFAEDGGLRESYAKAACATARLVWNWAKRYHRKEFQWNPWEDMRLEASDPRQVKWEPTQVWRFCQQAEQMGQLSVATVAVLCYELGQRVGDARLMCRSAFPEGDGIIVFEQGKTGKHMKLPVSDVLQSYLAKVPAGREELVINERSGRQFKDHEFSHAASEVREEANLPGHLWVADLRRTCINELAYLGASDDQLISVSGHSKRQTLSVYSLTEYRKALQVMQRRWEQRKFAAIA